MRAKTILSVLLAALFIIAAAVVAEEPAEKPSAPHFTNIDEAKAAAVANDRSIVLDFYATW
jgi:thiol:disulfide interchange protein